MAKGLNNADAACLVAHRGAELYRSIEEIWRRAGTPPAALERLAEADGFGGLGVARRRALWEVRGLADATLPLFAAADRGRMPEPEIVEAPVSLAAMREGQQVVEDYRSTGLSLRRHPLSFLRQDLASMGMITCGDLATTRDYKRIYLAGMVLVRQKPGSAKGVMFITVEDETGVANLIVWPSLFEERRRVILAAGMMGVRGRVQREGEVIHVIVQQVEDLTEMLRGVGQREGGPGDATDPAVHRVRNIYIPDLRLGSGIKVPTRDFR
jgi:error-prone DNA polymerase